MKIRLCILFLLVALAALAQPSYWFQGLQRKPDARQSQAYWFVPGLNMSFSYATNHVIIGTSTNVALKGITTNVTVIMSPSTYATASFSNGVIVSVTPSTAGGYGCLTMSTGTVIVATSTSTNLFNNYNYQLRVASIGIETNSNFVATNSGDYKVSFGCSMLGGNLNVVKVMVFTNGVHCPVVWFQKTMQAPAIPETGFKEFIVTLPALCRVSLRVANESAASVSIQQLCFNLNRADVH